MELALREHEAVLSNKPSPPQQTVDVEHGEARIVRLAFAVNDPRIEPRRLQ